MSNVALSIIFIVVMLPGILGVILPILPGIPYMFFVALVYGMIDKFVHLSGFELLILGIIAVPSVLIDYLSGLIGAKYDGATRSAMLFGFLGMIAGLIIFPPFGAIIGLFLGVFLAEMYTHQNHKRALKSTSYSLFGSLTGILINLAIFIMFIVLFGLFTI